LSNDHGIRDLRLEFLQSWKIRLQEGVQNGTLDFIQWPGLVILHKSHLPTAAG